MDASHGAIHRSAAPAAAASAVAADGANLPAKAKNDFCGRKLLMPNRFEAQNGLEITQDTPVGVTGCSKGLSNAQKLAARAERVPQEAQQVQAPVLRKSRERTYGAKDAKKHKSGK